ncbi:MAG: hypothetical protein R3E08_08595 [Thiotrichaceae bacterium]
MERLTKRLASHLLQQQVISATDCISLARLPLQLKDAKFALNATISSIIYTPLAARQFTATTRAITHRMDAHLQEVAQQILDQRLTDLKSTKNVNNG